MAIIAETHTTKLSATTVDIQEIKTAGIASQNVVKLTNTEVVLSSLLAGGIAGAIAKTTIAPLDRCKINFQIDIRPFTAKAAWHFLKQTFHQEGFIALWRGNSATITRIAPYAAVQFTAHEQWKRLLGVNDQLSAQKHPSLLFVSGSLAGITSQSLTYPLDLARARMAVTTNSEYRTLRQVFKKIWRYEGAVTLYRGYWATILGVIPYAGVSFFTYDSLKHAYVDYYGEKHPPIANLLFGGVAGMLGQSSSYPLDIVRRRMQTSKRRPDGSYPYATILSTLSTIYREEGIIKGFYKGLSMNWVKGPIAVGISFATYDFIKSSLRDVATSFRTNGIVSRSR